MSILNLTPDSFYDGGKFDGFESALQAIQDMADAGVQIIDVGGESTRPGSDPVPLEEELKRVIPVLKEAIPAFPKLQFSIDTTKPEVAKKACELGVHWINDISGLRFAPEMADVAAEYGVGYMLMHSIGNPKTMQDDPTYENVVEEVYDFLEKGIRTLQDKGIGQIVVDPGIGFGKTLQHNIALIKGINRFKQLGFPVLIGASRKRMIGAILNNRPKEGRLAGTLAVHYEALKQGADIIRVHDFQESMDIINIFKALQ